MFVLIKQNYLNPLLVFKCVHTHSSGVSIQPGFPSLQADKEISWDPTFLGESLVGQKTRLD